VGDCAKHAVLLQNVLLESRRYLKRGSEAARREATIASAAFLASVGLRM